MAKDKKGVGKIISKGNDINFNRYIKEVSKYPVLTAEEERNLFETYHKTGDDKILEKICKHNLLFVLKVARYYANKITDSSVLVLEDLISEGNAGLCVAAKNFDYTKNFRFLTYADWYVKQSIIKSIQDNLNSIRLPLYTRKYVVDFNVKKAKLEQKNHDDVYDLEVFDEMLKDGEIESEKKLNVVEHIIKINNQTTLTSTTKNDETENIFDLLPDKNLALPDEVIIDYEKKDLFSKILNSIDETSLKYISDFFGLVNEKPLNYCEIGRKYNVSNFVVKNRITKAIEKIKSTNKLNIEYYL